MKFRVERDVLAEAVTWTARTLPNRPPAPVLAGVRIEATNEGILNLASFDYEVSARSEIPAEVIEPGTVLVSGRLLAEISRALPNKPVDVTVEGTKVSVVCGASRFTLLTMPVEEYPSLPNMPEVTGVVVGDVLTEAVNQVTVAASRDDTLPLLTGVRVEIEGEKVTLLSTDRYRLALRELVWKPASPSISTVALVRARTLNDVAKSLGASGDVNIALSKKK
jgi:DNA polymerase-3 subunit beta